MGRIIYDDAMRHDPVRRAVVKARIERRQAAFATARSLVAEAAALLRDLGSVEDDSLLARSVKAVCTADTQMRSDEQFVMKEPNDTYLGNLAARGEPVGWVPTLADLHNALVEPEPPVVVDPFTGEPTSGQSA